MEFGIWNLEFGIWNLEFGIWNLEFGIFIPKLEIRNPKSRQRLPTNDDPAHRCGCLLLILDPVPLIDHKPGIIEQRFQFALSKAVNEHLRDIAIRRKTVAQLALPTGHVDQVLGKPAPTARMTKLLPKIVRV